MGFMFVLTKCLLFSLNIICLIMGVAAIALSAVGLQTAKPGTDEHTYFIVGIILGSFICMSTLLGFYGVIAELTGVTLIFACFVLMLMFLEYLQMQSFRPFTYFNHAVQHLRYSWDLVKVNPAYMHSLQTDYHCCGLNNSRDYNFMQLAVPSSCYSHHDSVEPTNLYVVGCLEALRKTYHIAIRRERLFSWSLLLIEGISFTFAIVMGIALYCRRRGGIRQTLQNESRDYEEPHLNHVNSRTNLLA